MKKTIETSLVRVLANDFLDGHRQRRVPSLLKKPLNAVDEVMSKETDET